MKFISYKKKVLLIILVVLFKFSFKAKAQQNTAKQPNVLLIYTDDHRFTGVHELGGQDVKTPNIDALANEGIVFTNTYLMGAFTGEIGRAHV